MALARTILAGRDRGVSGRVDDAREGRGLFTEVTGRRGVYVHARARPGTHATNQPASCMLLGGRARARTQPSAQRARRLRARTVLAHVFTGSLRLHHAFTSVNRPQSPPPTKTRRPRSGRRRFFENATRVGATAAKAPAHRCSPPSFQRLPRLNALCCLCNLPPTSPFTQHTTRRVVLLRAKKTMRPPPRAAARRARRRR